MSRLQFVITDPHLNVLIKRPSVPLELNDRGLIEDIDLSLIEKLDQFLLNLNGAKSLDRERGVLIYLGARIGQKVTDRNSQIGQIYGHANVDDDQMSAIEKLTIGIYTIRSGTSISERLENEIDRVLYDAARSVDLNNGVALRSSLAQLTTVFEGFGQAWSRFGLNDQIIKSPGSFLRGWPALDHMQSGVYTLIESVIQKQSRELIREFYEWFVDLVQAGQRLEQKRVAAIGVLFHVDMSRLLVELPEGRIKDAAYEWSWRFLSEQLWLLEPGATLRESDDPERRVLATDIAIELVSGWSQILKSLIDDRNSTKFVLVVDGMLRGGDRDHLKNTQIQTGIETALFLSAAWIIRRVRLDALDDDLVLMWNTVFSVLGTAPVVLHSAAGVLAEYSELPRDRIQRLGLMWWIDEQLQDQHEAIFIDEHTDAALVLAYYLAQHSGVTESGWIAEIERIAVERGNVTSSFRSDVANSLAQRIKEAVPRHLLADSDSDRLNLPRTSDVESVSGKFVESTEKTSKIARAARIRLQPIDEDKIQEFRTNFLSHRKKISTLGALIQGFGSYVSTDSTDMDDVIQLGLNYRFERSAFVADPEIHWFDVSRSMVNAIRNGEPDYFYKVIRGSSTPVTRVTEDRFADLLGGQITLMRSKQLPSEESVMPNTKLSPQDDLVIELFGWQSLALEWMTGDKNESRYVPEWGREEGDPFTDVIGYLGRFDGVPMISSGGEQQRTALLYSASEYLTFYQFTRDTTTPGYEPFELTVRELDDGERIELIRSELNQPDWINDESPESKRLFEESKDKIRVLVREWIKIEIDDPSAGMLFDVDPAAAVADTDGEPT